MSNKPSILDQNGFILDRIIEHYSLIISLDYPSIKNVLVWNHVMTMSESNKIFLESPTTEEAMKLVICLLSKSPSACKGFVQSLRNSGNPMALHVVKLIDPYEIYGTDNGVKIVLDNVIRRFRTAIRKLKRNSSNSWDQKYYSLDTFCKYNSLPPPTTTTDSWTSKTNSRRTPENLCKMNSLPRTLNNSSNSTVLNIKREFVRSTNLNDIETNFQPFHNKNKREFKLSATSTDIEEIEVPFKKSKLDDMCTFIRRMSFRRK